MYPYYQPQYQPQYQTQYQAPGMSGRLVNDFSEITIKDIPTDGSWAYFAKTDGSEIQARRWAENGSVIQNTYTRHTEPQIDPMQERLASIEDRLDKIEKSRARRKEPVDE